MLFGKTCHIFTKCQMQTVGCHALAMPKLWEMLVESLLNDLATLDLLGTKKVIPSLQYQHS